MLDDGEITTWLTDMDGVLVHEEDALPGAADFLAALRRFDRQYLVLTNNSIYTPRDLSARLLLAQEQERQKALEAERQREEREAARARQPERRPRGMGMGL